MIKSIRDTADKLNKPVAIMGDLQVRLRWVCVGCGGEVSFDVAGVEGGCDVDELKGGGECGWMWLGGFKG